ncbi:siderophore ABC transporter substrate-binding protein [Salinicoccus sp. CNSTN-B1]
MLDYGILDTLDKLDVEVAGVLKGSLPTYLDKYNGSEYVNVGAAREPDLEEISAMNPDLIIISGREAEMYEEIKQLGPTIYLPIDFTNYMEEFTNNMETVGKIFGKEDEISKELKELDEKMNDVKDKATEVDEEALIIMANGGKISAYGPGSRYGGLIHNTAGYKAADENIEDSRYGKSVNFEYVMKEDPGIVFVVDRNAALNPEHVGTKKAIENELFKKTEAYKNDQVYYLKMDAWFYGGGLQSMEMMIEDLDIF